MRAVGVAYKMRLSRHALKANRVPRRHARGQAPGARAHRAAFPGASFPDVSGTTNATPSQQGFGTGDCPNPVSADFLFIFSPKRHPSSRRRGYGGFEFLRFFEFSSWVFTGGWFRVGECSFESRRSAGCGVCVCVLRRRSAASCCGGGRACAVSVCSAALYYTHTPHPRSAPRTAGDRDGRTRDSAAAPPRSPRPRPPPPAPIAPALFP